MIGIALIVIGLVIWLVAGIFWAFVLCLILGLILIFWPGAPYGYSHYRRGPP